MMESLKGASVLIRKYNVKDDLISNAITIKGKVNDKFKEVHKVGKFYNSYISTVEWGDFEEKTSHFPLR